MEMVRKSIVNRFVLVLVIMGIAITGISPSAEAIPIGPTDFSPSATVIDFDSLAISTEVDDEFSGLGVIFSSPSGPGGVVSFLAPGQVLSVDDSIKAVFSVSVHRVGLGYSSFSALTLEVYNASGTQLESLTLSAGSGFLGIDRGNEAIAYIITHDSGSGFTIDNFTFENPISVPEPGTILLLGSGLAALGLWGRMRRKGVRGRVSGCESARSLSN